MSYGYPGGDPNQGGYGQSGPQQPGGYGQSGPQQPGGYGQSGPQQPGGYGQGGYDPNAGGYGQQGGGYGGGYGTGGGGYGGGGYGGGQPPSNWLVPAIISILCCWPLAIPAIIFATQVNSKFAAGDYAGAQDAAGKAKLFSLIAIGIGVVITVIYIILILAGAIGGATSSTY